MSAEDLVAGRQASLAPRPRPANVCHVVFRPDSLTYTVAKALSWGGHRVQVVAADPAYRGAPPNKIHRLLEATDGVQLAAGDPDAAFGEFDRLIVQVYPRLLECAGAVAPLAGRSRAITLVTAGDRSRGWAESIGLQRRELQAFRRLLPAIDRVVYKDGFHRTDLFALLKPRGVVGFDVHSQFLHDPQAFRVMHAQDWDPQARRPFRVNFLGSRDPQARRRVVDAVRPAFLAEGGRPPAAAGWDKDVFWHEYSDAEPAGLAPADFIDVLTRSDFTLCPPGYSLVTHRPFEALMRGSIPVLNARELDLYAIDLEDGVNCIAVERDDWAAAMGRIASMAETEIVAMRCRVRAMLGARVSYDSASRAMRERLGVPADGIADSAHAAGGRAQALAHGN